MSDHEWFASASGYALDALDPGERAAFEAHLAQCAVCRDEVRTLRETAALLAHAAPVLSEPAALRDRVLAEARRVQPIGTALKGQARRAVPWLVAAAALVLLAVGMSYRSNTGDAALRAEIAGLRQALARQDSTLAALLAPEVHLVSLAADQRRPTVRVFWNHERRVFVVTAFDLPRAPDGRTYQLWALAKDKAPLSMGTFNSDSAGRAILMLQVDAAVQALGFLDNCALTQEPAGGSPGPTETPRLVGAWRHAD